MNDLFSTLAEGSGGEIPVSAILPRGAVAQPDTPDTSSDFAHWSGVDAARREDWKSRKVAAIVEGLNPEQQAAVTHESGPLLVMAGAGSGLSLIHI